MSCKLSPMETICMKCLILFSGQNKININWSSAELAQRMVKVKGSTCICFLRVSLSEKSSKSFCVPWKCN